MSSLRLVELADLVANGPDGEKTIALWQDNTGGVIQGTGLLKEPPGDDELHPGGGVAFCRMKEGQEFPPHYQEYCTEILIVLGGMLQVTIIDQQEGTVVLGPGMHVALQPGVVHRVKALADTTVVGVTVPKDGGYPDAPEFQDRTRSE